MMMLREREDFTPLSERASPPLQEHNNRYLQTMPAARKMTEQHESTPSPVKTRRTIRNLPNQQAEELLRAQRNLVTQFDNQQQQQQEQN